jgi:uncharacterized protein involved in exopolysaccharide biosynthesis
VIALMITVPLAYLYLKVAPRQYFVKASLLLKSETQTDMAGSEDFIRGMNLYTSQTGIEDVIGILKSYSMVDRAMRELDFGISYFTEKNFIKQERYRNAPFTIVIDSVVNQIVDIPIYIDQLSSTRYRVRASGKNVNLYNFYTHEIEGNVAVVEIDEEVPLDKRFANEFLNFQVTFNDMFKVDAETESFFVLNRLQGLTEGYQSKLNIDPISLESYIVELGIKGPVVEKERIFLEKLLEVYLRNELYKKNQLGLKTIQFIDEQLSGVSDTLRRVEGSLELFRSRNNILDISSTAEALNRNLDRLESEQANLESRLKYYRFVANSLQNNKVNEVISPSSLGVDDPVLNNLLLELAALSQEKTSLTFNTKDTNPLTEIVDQKIANTRKAIVDNVNNMIEVSSIALTDLNNRVFQIRKNLSVLPRNERELVNIQRRFDFNDNVYNYLLEKRAEAGIAIASNSVEKTVVDKPYQAGGGPVSPNSKMIYAFAVVCGLGMAVALIIFRDVMNENIITHEDVEQTTKIPFIGSITHANKREQGSIIAHARSPIGESFRSLRVNLQYLTLGKNANVIGITSSRESEGKTFCAVNLAAVMAYAGRRTVLIDTDMRRPRVAAYFQLKSRKGLSNFLVGDGSIREIINNTEHKGFDVIGSGPIPPNPIDLIGSPRMEELINTLKQT